MDISSDKQAKSHVRKLGRNLISTKQRYKDYAKAKIDKTQQDSILRLCGDRDETSNHIISKCSRLARRKYKTRHDWGGGQGDPLGIVEEIKIWPHKQMIYAQPRIRLRKWDARSSLGFWDINVSSNLGQTTTFSNSQQLEVLEIRGRVEIIQELLRSVRILRRVLETWRDWLSYKPL